MVCASKVYAGLGADIVMESFHSLTGFWVQWCDELAVIWELPSHPQQLHHAGLHGHILKGSGHMHAKVTEVTRAVESFRGILGIV